MTAHTAQQTADRIVSFVRERGGALFHEIVADIGDEARGEGTLQLMKNVVLWTGVSELFVEAFQLALPKLEPRRANPKFYAVFSDEDGFPNLPIVPVEDWQKEIQYETPMWLPLVFFFDPSRANTKVVMQETSDPNQIPTGFVEPFVKA